MAITKEEVLHVAQLARLALDNNEVPKFQEQLSIILEYVASLQQVKTSDVDGVIGEMFNAHPLRSDEVQLCTPETLQALMDTAPAKKNGYIKAPGVFE